MSNGVTFKYHLPHRIILSVIFAGMWIPLLWVGGNLSLDTLLFVALNVAVVLAGIWSVSVIEIGQNGVTLYRVNKLDWSDVSSAKKVLFLGDLDNTGRSTFKTYESTKTLQGCVHKQFSLREECTF